MRPLCLFVRFARFARFATFASFAALAALAGCADPALSPTDPPGPEGPDLCAGPPGGAATPGTRIALAVGQWRLLSGAEASCFRFPGGDGEYAVTWLDVRDIERQQSGWVTGPLPSGTAIIEERTTPRTSVREIVEPTPVALAAARRPGPAAITDASQTAACRDDSFPQSQFWCRSRPWTMGEQFTVRSTVSATGLATATITFVSDDARFVVAEVPGGNEADAAIFRESLRQALPIVMQHAVPWYRRMFGAEPLTSRGSGQLLLLFGPYAHGLVAGGCCFGETGLSNYIALGVGLRRPPAEMVQLLAHELAHAWVNRWFYESRPAGGFWAGGDTSGNEGLADLLAFEVLRRVAGLPFAANASAAPFGGDAITRSWALEFSPTGDFLAGYAESSGFLRDLVHRLVRRGMSVDDAFALVARHASEGWYGFDPVQGQRTGLVRAMRQAFGPTWDPTDALRLFMLAQAADDLTSNAELQNPFRQGVSAFVGSDLRVGGREGRPSVTFAVPFGGMGAARLLDRRGGATFEARGSGATLVWGIARVR